MQAVSAGVNPEHRCGSDRTGGSDLNTMLLCTTTDPLCSVVLSQLWCDFDKSNTFRNQTFNESAPVPDICFYPEVPAQSRLCCSSTSLSSLHAGGGDGRNVPPTVPSWPITTLTFKPTARLLFVVVILCDLWPKETVKQSLFTLSGTKL